jgi:hypothetical protein
LIFRSPIPARIAYHFARWLARGTSAEAFPKQDSVDSTRPYGNWIRLHGRHHTREHWERVWSWTQERWLEGAEAVAEILSHDGDDPAKLAGVDYMPPLCGSYNDFDAGVANTAFEAFNCLTYYNANNPNNGRDAFQYDFAWEGSHAVYITARWHYPVRILDETCRFWRKMPREEFNSRCQGLARKVAADESDATDDGWRLWWD